MVLAVLELVAEDDSMLDEPAPTVIALTSPVSVAATDSSEAKIDAPMTVEAAPAKPVKEPIVVPAVDPMGMVVMGWSRASAYVPWSIQPSIVLVSVLPSAGLQ